MNINAELDRSDRATLAVWRTLNVAGWTTVALLLTVAFHVLADALTTAWLSGCCSVSSLTFDAVAGDETATVGHVALRAGLSVGLGALIGGVVGPRVAHKPVLVATAVALLYAVAAIVLIHRFGGGATGIITIEETATGPVETRRVIGGMGWILAYDAVISLVVPAAAWIGRRTKCRST